MLNIIQLDSDENIGNRNSHTNTKENIKKLTPLVHVECSFTYLYLQVIGWVIGIKINHEIKQPV